MHAASQDFKAFYTQKAVYGGTLTAAGTGDNTEVTSDAIDRGTSDSAQLVVSGRTNCAASQTLKFTTKIAESDDGLSFGSDTTLENAVTYVVGAASPQNFCVRLDLAVKGRKRYIRIKLTPDLSAGSTDTAQWGACVILGGSDSLPAV